MTKEEILINLKELSLEDKLVVLAKLNTLIRIQEQESKYKDMVSRYIGTMEELVGKGFFSRQRRQEAQAKVVTAVCLMEDGQSLVSAARILGVDHSTVSHYKKVWQDALKYPKFYSDLINLYNKYRAAL